MKLSGHALKILIPIQVLAITLGIYFFETQYLWYMLLGWILISGYGVALGYHRLLSHRAFKCWGWAEKLMSWLAVMSGQGSPLFWVAVHRGYHHRYSDQEKDLHSPISHSKWDAYMGWIFKFKPESITLKSATDMMRDDYQRMLHEWYYSIFWGSLIIIALIDPMVALYMFLIPAAYSHHEIGAVNILGHAPEYGYRNFKTKDQSSNFWLLGFFGWGQGYHNNHHAKPKTYDYGERWFEWDWCKLLVLPVKSNFSGNITDIDNSAMK